MLVETTLTISLAFSGFCVGYITATVSESLLHRCVGHASVRSRQRSRVIPFLFRFVTTLHFGHTVVHHKKTFRSNHVTQFTDHMEREQLDTELVATGRGVFIRTQYGLITDVIGTLYFAAPPLFLCMTTSFLLLSRLSPTFLIAAAVPISWPPLLSRFLHPLLHRPCKVAKVEAGPFVAWLLSTRYGRWARITHYVHHRHPRYNFNLLPGGDFLLGCYRAPRKSELADMKAIGLLESSDDKVSENRHH